MRKNKKLLFLSSKGGVGKTTVIANLGYMLATGFEKKVGLIDLNFCAPYLPTQLGVENRKMGVEKKKIFPVKILPNLFIVSNEFFLDDKEAPIIMRNYMYKMIASQIINDVDWDDYDYLFFDTPSVFSDEIMESIKLLKNIDGVIIVTQSQNHSIMGLKRTLRFVEQYHLPLIGIIENMVETKCPECNKVSPLFSREKFKEFVEKKKVKVIARIPFDREILKSTDNGISFVQRSSSENDISIFKQIINTIEEFPEKK